MSHFYINEFIYEKNDFNKVLSKGLYDDIRIAFLMIVIFIKSKL